MIEVKTLLALEATGFDKDYTSEKKIVALMSPQDALALYTLLINSDLSMLSRDWQKAISLFARELLKAGNKCR